MTSIWKAFWARMTVGRAGSVPGVDVMGLRPSLDTSDEEQLNLGSPESEVAESDVDGIAAQTANESEAGEREIHVPRSAAESTAPTGPGEQMRSSGVTVTQRLFSTANDTRFSANFLDSLNLPKNGNLSNWDALQEVAPRASLSSVNDRFPKAPNPVLSRISVPLLDDMSVQYRSTSSSSTTASGLTCPDPDCLENGKLYREIFTGAKARQIFVCKWVLKNSILFSVISAWSVLSQSWCSHTLLFLSGHRPVSLICVII